MLNGDGLRVVLWLSGCIHKCKGCQNSQTWNENSGIEFNKEAEDELFRELNKDYISGITFTGGDPLYENNLDEVLKLVNQIRLLLPQKTIWLYTGYQVTEVYHDKFLLSPSARDLTHVELDSVIVERSNQDEKRNKIVSICDVLVDGRYEEDKRDITLKWCGSSNQRVIDVKKSIEQKKIVLWD